MRVQLLLLKVVFAPWEVLASDHILKAIEIKMVMH